MKCPRCNSENVRFRVARNNYICDDCDFVFEEQSTPQTNSADEQNLKKYDIFISYRRQGQSGRDCSIHESKSLFNKLNVKYKDKVLRDLETFQFQNWIKQIVYGVENIKRLLVLI